MIEHLYCDGGVIGRNPSEKGGTWAWCGVDNGGNMVASNSGVIDPAEWGYLAGVCGPFVVTNNVSELIAVLEAVESVDLGWSGTVYSDSQITLGRVFMGWARNGIRKKLSDRLDHVIDRMGEVQHVLLQGHPTKADLARGIGKKRNLPVSVHNVWCDKECSKRAKEWGEKQAL